MRIAEVSDLTGVSADMIRHYEKLGLITPKRLDNGYREFTPLDSYAIILIKQFNSLGISLKSMTSLGLDGVLTQQKELELSLISLKEERKWLESKIANIEDFLHIFQSYSSGKKIRILEFKQLYYYHHPLTLVGFSHKAPEIIANLGSFRYCFRVEKRNYGLPFPNDLGFLTEIEIPNCQVDYQVYKNITVCRSFIEWPVQKDSHNLISAKELEEHFNKIKMAGYAINGDCFISQITSHAEQGKKDLLCIDVVVQ